MRDMQDASAALPDARPPAPGTLPPRTVPTLDSIHRRRVELWVVTVFVLVLVTITFAALSLVDSGPAGWPGRAARLSLVALAIGFGVYLLDAERRTRGVTAQLVDAKVLEAALLNRLAQSTSLERASHSLGRAVEVEDSLDAILQIGIELLEADEGSIMLVDDGALVVAAAVGRARSFAGQRVAIGEGLAGRVAESRRGVVLEGSKDGGRGADIRCAISVPLLVSGDLVGVLNLAAVSARRSYDEHDLRATARFGEQAALAIRQARARRRDRARAEMAASMADDLERQLQRVRRSVSALGREDAPSDLARADAIRALEHDVDRAAELARWLGATREPE